ncbi:MAG: tetratricopeptide repeat protein, partial [Bacteroidetes bacterium]|nr:tetratricopeptide repeat protein [Bacteroidota bacterium]
MRCKMKAFLVGIQLLCVQTLFGQASAIDSLKNYLKTEISDSATIVVYTELSNQYKSVNLDSFKWCLEKALAIKSCKECMAPRAEALLAYSMFKTSRKDSNAIELTFEALDIYKQLNNVDQVANMLYEIGNQHIHLGNSTDGKIWLRKSIVYATKHNLNERKASALANMGYLFARSGIYDSAAVCLRTALEIDENDGKKSSQMALLNIGVVYFHSGNTEMAITYYKRALERAIEENDERI